MITPRTKAGRALDGRLFSEHSHDYAAFGYTEAIAAIEAEAAEPYREALRDIAIIAGEDMEGWEALAYPTHQAFAVRAVRQLREDYDEAIREAEPWENAYNDLWEAVRKNKYRTALERVMKEYDDPVGDLGAWKEARDLLRREVGEHDKWPPPPEWHGVGE